MQYLNVLKPEVHTGIYDAMFPEIWILNCKVDFVDNINVEAVAKSKFGFCKMSESAFVRRKRPLASTAFSLAEPSITSKL